jgi:hypothetical protein
VQRPAAGLVWRAGGGDPAGGLNAISIAARLGFAMLNIHFNARLTKNYVTAS